MRRSRRAQTAAIGPDDHLGFPGDGGALHIGEVDEAVGAAAGDVTGLVMLSDRNEHRPFQAEEGCSPGWGAGISRDLGSHRNGRGEEWIHDSGRRGMLGCGHIN